ncbi:hypothetical protein [Paucibacter sp. XJ19-41]|uniref:hypothetical protein n=1 Tax=Paucibacter sp. XJ19-41 TaxID=2927824 RepID=UPI002349290E|nr:hypothetical protein [Paucibacter sp. XJ19-41]MDC6169770.1 hypothetical protein [Paucibacter sp. XJ19-41]
MTSISNNERLRELVASSGLPPAVALTIFNRGLGANACTSSAWTGYLSDPASPHYRELSTELLSHAETQFAAALP